MNGRKSPKISRRQFAQRAAIASAAAAIVPANILPTETSATPALGQQPPGMPKLSPESQAEVEARIQAIFGEYGSRFSAEQKTDIQRLCYLAQPSLDRLRAYNLENGDSPALYLKPLVEREKKPAAPPPTSKSAAAPKKS